MKKCVAVIAAAVVLAAAGCTANVVAEHGAAVAEVGGLASAYVSVENLRPYDGTIFRLGILDMAEHPGEIANLDVWPLGGAGIGLIGARARLLMLGAGAGILWYQPQPPGIDSEPEPVP